MFSNAGPFSAAIGIDFDGPDRDGVRVLTGGRKAGHDPPRLALAILDARRALDRLQPPPAIAAPAQT